jgi:hypothetical protein
LEVYPDGRPSALHDLFAQDAEDRCSADGERDEQCEPTSGADDKSHGSREGDRNDHRAASEPGDDLHRVSPRQRAVVHEPAGDFGVERG